MIPTTRGATERIRVLLVDEPVVGAGLNAVLARARDIAVAVDVPSPAQAVTQCARLKPHVVMLDARVAANRSGALVQRIHEVSPATRVVALCADTAADALPALIELGITGFISRRLAHRNVADAIRLVARGDVYVSAEIAHSMARQLRGELQAASRLFHLDSPNYYQRRRPDDQKIPATEWAGMKE